MLRKIVGRTASSSFNQLKVSTPTISTSLLALRYQSSSSTTTTTTTTTSTTGTTTTSSTPVSEQQPVVKQEDIKKKSKREYVPINPKLQDISEQIKSAILKMKI